jgi:predicted N-acetyltransferase YhbS
VKSPVTFVTRLFTPPGLGEIVRLELHLPLCIRPHQAADYRRLCALVEGAFEEWRARIGNDAFLAALDHILACEPPAPGQVLVAEQGSTVVGTVTYHGFNTDPRGLRPDRWSAAHRLAVAPDVRRQGVGRGLLEACIARAREDGAEALCLYSPASMAAGLALCEALGFRPCPALDFRSCRTASGDGPAIAQALYLPLE